MFQTSTCTHLSMFEYLAIWVVESRITRLQVRMPVLSFGGRLTLLLFARSVLYFMIVLSYVRFASDGSEI